MTHRQHDTGVNFLTSSKPGEVRLELNDGEKDGDALWLDGSVAQATLWAHDILESTRKACVKAEADCPHELLRALEALKDFQRGVRH